MFLVVFFVLCFVFASVEASPRADGSKNLQTAVSSNKSVNITLNIMPGIRTTNGLCFRKMVSAGFCPRACRVFFYRIAHFVSCDEIT